MYGELQTIEEARRERAVEFIMERYGQTRGVSDVPKEFFARVVEIEKYLEKGEVPT